jgi:hypothetical protein
MKRTIVIGVAALVFAATASAATPTGGWTKPDMKTAIRGLGYPKPHPKKLGCRAAGSTAFRCVATYRRHRHRRFVIGGTGVWLCAGKTLDGCGWLRHGFVTNTQLEQHYAGHLATAALFAARGYMAIKYGITYTTSAPGGGQTGPMTWTYSYYTSDTTTVLITITLKQARGGYVVSAAPAS